MIWGAHKADGRLAAKNATKIRAALGQQIDPKRVYERYQETQPIPSGNLAQDRARARAWAMLNVGLDMEAVYTALVRTWTEAFVMGQLAAREAIQKTKDLQKADNAEYIDWDNWTPGDEVTAALVRPPDALKRLLDQAGTRIRGLDKESYDEIGSALGESIALGLSSSSAARLIRSKVHSASRALTIAITETNRVASYAAMQTYKEYGLEKQEWQAISPCDKCAINEGAVVEIGSPFPSGVTQPPQHPHCRCALLPVIPDMSDQPNENGVVDIAPRAVQDPDVASRFQERAGLTPIGTERSTVKYYTGNGYSRVNNGLRTGTFTDYRAKDAVDVLDNLISRAPVLPSETVTFRGVVDEFATTLKDLPIGATFSDPGYVSTSFSEETAERFLIRSKSDRVMLEIINPEGSAGLSASVFDENPDSRGEFEWLLPRGSKFEIVSKTADKIVVRIVK